MKSLKKALCGAVLGLAAAGGAQAANVAVNTNISTSTTWTSDNVYNLVGQVYVLPGATLTIQAGTQIKSNPADQGSLAICRGGKIIAIGTATQPIVFTSTSDTGTSSHLGVNEWGNVTIMGKALISASHANGTGHPVQTYDETPDGVSNPVSNTLDPTGLNKATMEGLTASVPGDPNVIYGGNDDNDDSGTLAYVSLRYGGKVVGLNNELNGLSLGGVGRATDIHHIDIWQNVDDGVEIWGGTVNLKYLNIWNIGDDSFDVDQGWRGKAQFLLLVQGYGANADQGSGVGDNVVEIDGAERSDAQPVTTATLYNVTAIGQPGSNGGDQGIAFRDGARVQFRNSIFMDLGESLIKEEASESTTGDWRYGLNGTPTFLATWTTAYTASHDLASAATVNHLASDTVASLQARYQAQSAGNASIGQGFLNEVTDSVFYNNTFVSAYSNTNGADAVGVTSSGASNPAKGNVVAASTPITTLTRDAAVNPSGLLLIQPVATLDPRAANDAVTSISAAPADGFFTPAKYRGAFSDKVNWAKGWTAADAYGKFVGPANPTDPSATIALTTSTSFQTTAGVTYTVESSADGVNWTPIGTIVGDGTIKSVTDLSPLVNAKQYRAIAQ